MDSLWPIFIIFALIVAFAIAMGYFVVKGRNEMQAKALADELEKRKREGRL
ncbi:hypothetical protein ACFRFH_14405 [Leifsonia sp. NPDC056824]|uniref:hypothetical protein n=1 Tax=Leifsonia sp. NPDC056824 TaxID=3345953 RepID=UPI003680B8C5